MTNYKDLYEKKCVQLDVMKLNLNILHGNLVDSITSMDVNEYTIKVDLQLNLMYKIINK